MLSAQDLLIAFWIFVPAFVPNSTAVLAGGGRTIDSGRMWRGKRLLGEGKTWRGFVFGVIGGVSAALLVNAVRPEVNDMFGLGIPHIPVTVAVALATGAMLGDMGASFFKRRMGHDRGAAVPVVDQLDFVVGAGLCALLVAPEWVTGVITLPIAALILVGTPLLHRVANILAYSVGVKNEPW